MPETNIAELEIKPAAGRLVRVYALIWVAIGLGLFLSYLLIGGSGDLLAQRTTVTTYMPDATGLTTTSEVRLSGLPIGKVEKIGFSGLLDPQRAIRVELRLLKRQLKSIPMDSQSDIDSDTLVGYAFVGIIAGKSTVPVVEGGVLQSEPLKQAVDRADLMKVLQDNLTGVDKLLIEVSSGQTKLGRFVLGNEEYTKVLSGIGDFERTMRAVMTPKSQLGQAFFSLQLYNQIRNMALRTDAALESIQRGEGAAGSLFASDAQYDGIVRQLTGLHASLADANAGKGRFGAMLQDEQSYRNLRQMLAATDRLLASLNAGEGAGRLLANPQLYESLNGSMRAMEALLRDVRENPRKYLRVKVF